MLPYSTLNLVRIWIHARASVYAAFGWFLLLFLEVFYGPLYLTVACSALFVLEEYSYVDFLGDDFRIHRIQLRRVLFLYTAQYLVLSGTCCASVTEFADFHVLRGNRPRILRSIQVATADFSAVAAQLQGRRHPFRVVEAG